MREQFLVRARRALVWTSCLAVLATAGVGCGGEDPDPEAQPPSHGGEGGSGGAGGEGGSDPDGSGGAGGHAGEGDGGKEESRRFALFVASDFDAKAELAVVDLDTNEVKGHLSFEDQDTLPYASGGRGFALRRTDSALDILKADKPFEIAHSVDVKEDDTPTNPYAAVVTAKDKAYVVRYAHNALKIVDLATGQSTGEIDLGGFLHADDPDGLIDVQDGVYDPASKRAYFLMGRINQFDWGEAPDYVSECLPFGAAIVGIDTETNEILDLNGDAPGQAIELEGQNPSGLAADFASGRLIVLQGGCYVPKDNEDDPPVRKNRGIEEVSLTSGSASWLYQTTELDRLSYLLWLGPEQAYIGKGFPTTWHPWKPTDTSLGDAEELMPELPVWDGTRIVGLSNAEDGSANVVAFDPVTREVSPIANNIFATSGLYTYGSAIVR